MRLTHCKGLLPLAGLCWVLVVQAHAQPLSGPARQPVFDTSSTYTNPVTTDNHPDPGVLLYNGTFYAVTTSGDDPNRFPILTSTDLVHWTCTGYVFPANSSGAPSWAVSDYWAPEIHMINSKQFNVVFAARHSDGTLSVGAATSSHPLGPYEDRGAPLVHTPGMGNIDASMFLWKDTHYLIWKRDGNGHIPPVPTPIFAQPLTADGLTLVGNATQLIRNDQKWEGFLVEGPWVVEDNGTFYLFYSGNGYTSPDYAVGVARSNSFLGPYEKHDGPVLTTIADKTNRFAGPGHCSVVRTNAGSWYIVYHAWYSNAVNKGPRVMLVDDVSFESGWPTIGNASHPSNGPEPLPAV